MRLRSKLLHVARFRGLEVAWVYGVSAAVLGGALLVASLVRVPNSWIVVLLYADVALLILALLFGAYQDFVLSFLWMLSIARRTCDRPNGFIRMVAVVLGFVGIFLFLFFWAAPHIHGGQLVLVLVLIVLVAVVHRAVADDT